MNILNKRVIIVTGKGGVGKSTITTLLAIAALKKGKKVLVCEINAKEKVAPYLGYPESGSKVTELEKGLSTVNINFQDAMKEYALKMLKSSMLYKTVFENKPVKRFLSGIPGLPEILIWGKIRFHETEKDKKGKNKYDLIIIDAPATGHGISFLKLPDSILGMISKGSLAKEIKAIRELLIDKNKTSINIVTIPEELPVNEAKELVGIIKDNLEMPLGYLFINQVVEKLFTDNQYKIFRAITKKDNKELQLMSSAANHRISREKLNEKYLKIANNHIQLPSISFPYLFKEKMSRKDFEYLADIFFKGSKF